MRFWRRRIWAHWTSRRTGFTIWARRLRGMGRILCRHDQGHLGGVRRSGLEWRGTIPQDAYLRLLVVMVRSIDIDCCAPSDRSVGRSDMLLTCFCVPLCLILSQVSSLLHAVYLIVALSVCTISSCLHPRTLVVKVYMCCKRNIVGYTSLLLVLLTAMHTCLYPAL